MEEPPRTPSSRQIRTSRANRLLSQFKGIIKARKTKDDRELGDYPYPSQTGSIDTGVVMKPYMSQPHLGLRQISGNGQHDSEFKSSKRSGSSERSPALAGTDAQPAKPSVNQDFPLRASPTSVRSGRRSDASHTPPSSHPRSTRGQPLGTVGSINGGNGRSIDGLPVLMDPTKPLPAVSGIPTPATSPQTLQAQPALKHPATPGASRRPSTAQASYFTTSSASASASPIQRPGPLLKLKRSFSQLRLNSFSKQHPDVPSPNPPHAVPSIVDSTSATSIPTGSQLPSSSPPPISTRPSKPSEPLPAASSSLTSSLAPVVQPNTTTIATISAQLPNAMAASGPLAPIPTHPKPLPPTMNLQKRAPAQPPKLSLSPINHRISLTIPTEMGYARLSPTIITRPTPLPLANLPTLTPKADLVGAASGRGATGSSSGPSRGAPGGGSSGSGPGGVNGRTDKRAARAQLNSMPALPLQGKGRGVGGREEVDDREDDDEEEDDLGDDTGDDEEGSSRMNSSDLLGSDMSEDSVVDAWASYVENNGRFDRPGQDNYLRPKEMQRRVSSSSGSSYHSALGEPSSMAYTHAPEFMGVGLSAVPLLKQPTPPYARLHAHTRAPLSASSQSQSHQTQTHIQGASTGVISSTPSPNQNRPTTTGHQLPEVDTSSIDLPLFSSRGLPPLPTTTSSSDGTPRSPIFGSQQHPVGVDVKGKGKARDFSNSIVIGGRGEGEHHYDPAKTPTSTSHNAAFHGFAGGATVTATATTTTVQARGGSLMHPLKSPVAQSPTGTLRQQLHHQHQHQHATGSGDYFSAKGIAASTPTATTSPETTQQRLSRSSTRPYSHYSSHTSNRYSNLFTPTSQVTTPRPGMGGTRTSFIMPGMQTPKRSSTLKINNPDAGVGGGDGVGGGQYVMPKMYKRASQSLIDLHTIETKEKRRMMEEEARAEEDEELAKMREKEKEREKEKKEKQMKRQSRIEDEKIKEDYDDEEAAERRDHLGAPISPSVAHAPVASPVTGPTSRSQNRQSRTSIYLRRRRSMPMFDESTEPPPYPSFAPHHPKYKVMPREDEGREKLPSYTNSIHLKAIMPRKMEFSAPNTQARDRKWRRVLCVLEGTVFKVYKCPSGHAGVGVLGEWWEKRVGAGDVSLQPSHAGTPSTIQIETRESRRLAEERRDFERQVQRIMKAEGRDFPEEEEDDRDMVIVPAPSSVPSVVVQDDGGSYSHSPLPTTPSRSRFTSFLKPGKNHARSKSDVHLIDRNTPSPSPRPSLNIPRSGMSTPISMRSPSPYSASMRPQTAMSSMSMSSQSGLMDSTLQATGRATPASSSYSSMLGAPQQQLQQQFMMTGGPSAPQHQYTNRERDFVPDAGPEDLIRAYTMQQAESGLGNDYTKRKNVIRVRLEGEQFLLQARDVTGVVEWIEALQAATNIALDLDERPMPRGPLFPRRRRRRRPAVGGAVSNATEGGQVGPTTGGRTAATQ